jgi:hypothetical protein
MTFTIVTTKMSADKTTREQKALTVSKADFKELLTEYDVDLLKTRLGINYKTLFRLLQLLCKDTTITHEKLPTWNKLRLFIEPFNNRGDVTIEKFLTTYQPK